MPWLPGPNPPLGHVGRAALSEVKCGVLEQTPQVFWSGPWPCVCGVAAVIAVTAWETARGGCPAPALSSPARLSESLTATLVLFPSLRGRSLAGGVSSEGACWQVPRGLDEVLTGHRKEQSCGAVGPLSRARPACRTSAGFGTEGSCIWPGEGASHLPPEDAQRPSPHPSHRHTVPWWPLDCPPGRQRAGPQGERIKVSGGTGFTRGFPGCLGSG